MSRTFRFSSHRLQELINERKCLREGVVLEWKSEGTNGKSLRVSLDLVDGPFVDFVLHVTAGDLKHPATYRGALVLEGERVRGLDFSELERSKFYKSYIAKGWHQNIIDPSLPLTDKNRNRHVPVENLESVDLADFLRKLCDLWHIDFAFDEGLL